MTETQPLLSNSSDDYVWSQWENLLDLTEKKSNRHKTAATMWAVLTYFFGFVTIGISAVSAAEGIKTYLPEGVLTILNITNTVLLTITTTMVKPSDRKVDHTNASKTFRKLYYDIRHCETPEEYNKLKNDYGKTIEALPALPFFLSVPMSDEIHKEIMNPKLKKKLHETLSTPNTT